MNWRTVGNYTRKRMGMAKRADYRPSDRCSWKPQIAATSETEGSVSHVFPVWLDTLQSNLEVTVLPSSGWQGRRRDTGASGNDGAGMGERTFGWTIQATRRNSKETRDVWTYATGLISAYLATMNQLVPRWNKKQAIATIDERTT